GPDSEAGSLPTQREFAMQVDQRQVTTGNLHDGRVRGFVLHRDGHGFKLTCVSKDDVVNILLSTHHFQKLRHELGKHEMKDIKPGKKDYAEPAQFGDDSAEPYVIYQWSTHDWLSFN